MERIRVSLADYANNNILFSNAGWFQESFLHLSREVVLARPEINPMTNTATTNIWGREQTTASIGAARRKIVAWRPTEERLPSPATKSYRQELQEEVDTILKGIRLK